MPKAENLERIVKALIRKRWSRAVGAVQFCLWVPKLIQQIQVRRAAKSLRKVAVAASRLAPRIEEAKRRIAERHLRALRRFRAAAITVRWTSASWRSMRERRRERLATALHRAALIS